VDLISALVAEAALLARLRAAGGLVNGSPLEHKIQNAGSTFILNLLAKPPFYLIN
jgi:hypothetical protein